MCKVAAVLGGSVEADFQKWYINQQLAEYFVLYSETEDVAWLDKIDQRLVEAVGMCVLTCLLQVPMVC